MDDETDGRSMASFTSTAFDAKGKEAQHLAEIDEKLEQSMEQHNAYDVSPRPLAIFSAPKSNYSSNRAKKKYKHDYQNKTEEIDKKLCQLHISTILKKVSKEDLAKLVIASIKVSNVNQTYTYTRGHKDSQRTPRNPSSPTWSGAQSQWQRPIPKDWWLEFYIKDDHLRSAIIKAIKTMKGKVSLSATYLKYVLQGKPKKDGNVKEKNQTLRSLQRSGEKKKKSYAIYGDGNKSSMERLKLLSRPRIEAYKKLSELKALLEAEQL
eukprot:Gb_07808 [translate_table: standard]